MSQERDLLRIQQFPLTDAKVPKPDGNFISACQVLMGGHHRLRLHIVIEGWVEWPAVLEENMRRRVFEHVVDLGGLHKDILWLDI